MSNYGKIILKPPDLPDTPRDDAGPVFAEPWQAQAFAMTIHLHEAGCFTWPEWATTLAAVLREAAAAGAPDDASRYYEHWLVALERLTIAKSLVGTAELEHRKDAWEAAYLATPHGQPVELSAP